MFKPSSNFLTDRSKAVLILWILLLFVFAILSCLFLAAVWSPAGKVIISACTGTKRPNVHVLHHEVFVFSEDPVFSVRS